MSIIKHDFGMEKRQSARRLTTLLSLTALHEANVAANPVPYLERASEQIYQLEKVLFEAALAAASPPDAAPGPTVTIDKAEYERLLACHAIVQQAVTDFRTSDDES